MDNRDNFLMSVLPMQFVEPGDDIVVGGGSGQWGASCWYGVIDENTGEIGWFGDCIDEDDMCRYDAMAEQEFYWPNPAPSVANGKITTKDEIDKYIEGCLLDF